MGQYISNLVYGSPGYRRVQELKKHKTEIEKIEKDIKEAKRAQKCTIELMKPAYSVLYVIFSFIFYFTYVTRSNHWWEYILYAALLILIPVFLYFVFKATLMITKATINKRRAELSAIEEQKQLILKEVEETELYKSAKPILKKYGGSTNKNGESSKNKNCSVLDIEN